jgi:hypothetical protein
MKNPPPTARRDEIFHLFSCSFHLFSSNRNQQPAHLQRVAQRGENFHLFFTFPLYMKKTRRCGSKSFVDRAFRGLLTSAPDESVEQAGSSGTRRKLTRPAALFNLPAGRPPSSIGRGFLIFAGLV